MSIDPKFTAINEHVLSRGIFNIQEALSEFALRTLLIGGVVRRHECSENAS